MKVKLITDIIHFTILRLSDITANYKHVHLVSFIFD